MVNVPNTILNYIKPYSQVPNAIWETIVWLESGFNPMAIGDGPQNGGYSYGLFQLHVADNGYTSQGNVALNLIRNRYGITGQEAITYLIQHPDIQAEVGMPPINDAWNSLRNSFSPLDTSWWLAFCSQSGHPGGTPSNGVTIAYVNRLMREVVAPNLFGIQQLGAGAGADTTTTSDSTWLQQLINLPPNQPCSVIWRRSCPGAKSANEGGIDLDSPNGTKVFALGDGTVIGAGYFWHSDNSPGYGVVTVRTPMPDGSLADIYYQHIQLSPAIILCNQTGGQLYNGVVGPPATNQTITKGQFLGTVTVGEVEVGVNAQWGGVWGDNHPGPWSDDPEQLIRSLIDNGGGTNTHSIDIITGNTAIDNYLATAFEATHSSVQIVTQVPGLDGPIAVFDTAQQFRPFAVPDDSSSSANWPIWGGIEQGASYPTRVLMGIIGFILNNSMAFFIRGIFVLISLVVIMALLINVFSKVQSNETAAAGQLLATAL